MKIYQVLLLLSPVALLGGCANPYDVNSCDARYQPPYYGTHPDSSIYDNDYYKNFEREHFGLTDHRYDKTYGHNQVYHPSEQTP